MHASGGPGATAHARGPGLRDSRLACRKVPLAVAAASIRTVLHLVPHLLPFLAPAKWSPALHAGFLRQLVLLAHCHAKRELNLKWGADEVKHAMSRGAVQMPVQARSALPLTAHAQLGFASQLRIEKNTCPLACREHRQPPFSNANSIKAASLLPSGQAQRAFLLPCREKVSQAKHQGARPTRVTFGAISPRAAQAPRG